MSDRYAGVVKIAWKFDSVHVCSIFEVNGLTVQNAVTSRTTSDAM